MLLPHRALPSSVSGLGELVWFAVLGPLGIQLDGRDIALTARRERALLAMLLLHANRPVSADQLIDAIWPSRLPRDARNQVQLCVAQLRRRLKSVGVDRTVVVTEPGGYRMTVGPDELDLFEFRQLVVDARASASAGLAEDASAAYHGALNLWRGPALADVESPLVRQAALTRSPP